MYMQITTKCNMTCEHCCYSCTKYGRHGDYNTILAAIMFAREHGEETISIGGGEPTLHPRFFDILKMCLQDFDYVWMATNGSQTEIMHRLSNIIDGEDYPECNCTEEDLELYDGCECYYNDDKAIYQEGKLSVALSTDCFHDPINEVIREMWERRGNTHKHSHFELRDVTNSHAGVVAQGRAKKTGAGWNEDDCVCSDIIIKPTGKLRLCGCDTAPGIGNVWQGVDSEWEKVLYDEKFTDYMCYKAWKKK